MGVVDLERMRGVPNEIFMYLRIYDTIEINQSINNEHIRVSRLPRFALDIF